MLQVLCFLAKFQDSTTRNVKLYCILKNNKKTRQTIFHSSFATKVAQSRSYWGQARLRPGLGWAGCAQGGTLMPGAPGAQTGRLLQQHITADKINPVINMESRS